MKFVHVKEKDIGKELLLIPLGDIHYGSKDCDVNKLIETINWIKTKPTARVMLMGDLIDIGLKDSIGAGTFDNNLTPEDQICGIIDLLLPISKQIIGMVGGNHESVVKDTDILTEDGWMNVQQVTKNTNVGQFDINSGKISFAQPLELIEHYSDEIIEIEGNNTKQAVTLNHDIVLNNKKIKANKLLNKRIKQNDMRLNGNASMPGIDLDSDIIRLLVWTIMDGTIVDYKKYNSKSKKIRIQFKLSKDRKIKELKRLLNSLDINYTFKPATMSDTNKLQPYYIRIYGDDARMIYSLLNYNKQIPENWKNMNKSQCDILLETIIKTDGQKRDNHISWVTTSTHNMNMVSYICTLNGYNFKYNVVDNGSGFSDDCLPQYRCNIYDKIQNNGVLISKRKYNDMTYCFTMPEGTLITRLDGKVAFTGNCRIQQRTSIDINKIIAQALNVKYCGSTAFLKIMVNKQNYIIFAAHGSTGSTTPAGKLNSVLKYGSYIDADLYLMGHCFDEKTEVLTNNGWKKYWEIQHNDNIMTLNTETKELEYNKINNFILNPKSTNWIKIQNKNTDLLVTNEHGMLALETRTNKLLKLTANQLKQKHNGRKILNAGKLNNFGLNIDKNLLKLLVWIVADGSYHHKKNKIRWHLSKTRKINVLTQLLKQLNIKFNIKQTTDTIIGNTTYNISADISNQKKLLELLPNNKELPQILKHCNDVETNIILDTYIITDGCTTGKNSIQIASSKEQELDLLQELCIKHNMRCNKIKRKNKNAWVLSINRKKYSSTLTKRLNQVKAYKYNGISWCLQVDNGTLVVRRNGKVSITQNCHELLHHTTEYFSVSKKDKMILKDKRHYVITGHFLKYGGYAEAKNYSPGKNGVAKIILRGDEHKINASI